MRYGTQTKLAPDEVMRRAREFFGAGSELGLPEMPYEDGSAVFGDQTGSVSVSAEERDAWTDVSVLSRELDHWAERFIRELG